MSEVITLSRKSFLVPIIPDKFQDLNDAQITILQLQRCLGDIVRSLQNSTLSGLTTPLADTTKLIVSNWTLRTSAADNYWFSVCWSPGLGLFVAVAAYSGTGNRIMTSPNGIDWTSRTSAADNSWVGVCWSPKLGLFVTVSMSGTGNRVMTSLFYK